MPSIKPFDITLGDINFLLDQMRDAIIIVGYNSAGEALYGFIDSANVQHELGTFGSFDPLSIIDPVTQTSIYDGAREASGFRIPIGFFNNLVDLTRWTWGATDNPFPRLTQADYDHYIALVLSNPALTNYVLPAGAEYASPTSYADLNTTVVDYTPRMITQLISSSYGELTAAVAVGNDNTYDGHALTLSDPAQAVFAANEMMVVTVSGNVFVVRFWDSDLVGSTEPQGANVVAIDVHNGVTMGDALTAIQAGFMQYGGADAASTSVTLDANGAVNVSLGGVPGATFSVLDYAGLGIGGTFDPTVPDNASAMIRMGVYTDIVTSENVIGVGGVPETITEYMVRNLNTLPGDPSTSGIFTLFGQFFDHGLDFINKGGQGSKIIIPLSVDDPLYRAPGTNGPSDPGNTTITISRATPDGYTVDDYHGRPISIAGADNTWGTADDLMAPGDDGVYGTADDVLGPMTKPETTTYTNHTSPFIDQSQSYGSDTQTTYILREWIEDPNNPGHYIPGAELLDGHVTQAYHSTTFDDASADGLNASGVLDDGTTTRTLPTLAELREHLRETGRADLSWDDINNLRARDAAGQVIDNNGATAGGYVYTGEALLLDINPRFDAQHLHPDDGNVDTVWDANATNEVDAAIAYLNAHMADSGRTGDILDFAVNPQSGATELHLTLGTDLSLGAGGTLLAGTQLYGAYAMAPWVNFSNFSITATDDNFYDAVGQIMMASIGDHYVAGDGRANENFGLTAIHHVFHANHNVQLVNLEKMVLSAPDVDARHGYQTAVSDGNGGFFTDSAGNYTLMNVVGTATTEQISWDQDKMFEAAKLINEMEYQHVAIDQYARLVTPDLPEFVTYDNDIQADISLEYSQAAFRFGHSQLRETIDAIDPNGMVTKWALEVAFLNPKAYALTGAEDILRGMSQQLSNEVDEFVTPAMQQTLLGQPLDLPAINIARGRDVGMPTLNEVRKQLHDALVLERQQDPTTPHHTNLIVDALNPYTSWAEFASQMQHPESLVDFLAAYGFDGDLAKATALVGLEDGSISEGDAAAMGYTVNDAIGVLNNSPDGLSAELQAAANAFNNIDFWIGGLAELHVFTGQLGTTFNAIFEDQMERLMDGDRFYYLYRLGTALNIDPDLGHAITTEQFKDIIERTTGALHLNGDVMGWADHTFELYRPATEVLATAGESIHDSTGATVIAAGGEIKYQFDTKTQTWVAITNFAIEQAYQQIVDRYAGIANGTDAFSTNANVGIGIYSGPGNGIAGDGTVVTKSNSDLGITRQYIADFRPDVGENPDGTPSSGYNSHEVFAGTDFDDWLDAGNGDDTMYGDKGDDVLDGKAGADHIYGGDGQDVIYGGDIEDFLDGGAGDDIIYAGTSAGALDVVIGGHGNDKIYGEAGIDEIYGGEGDDYIDAGGDTDLAFGDGGNDIMFGGDGPDELRGGEGDDMLSGGSGSDQLKGEHGDDIFFGGIGQAAQVGDSDENLGDTGFDVAAFSDTSIALDVAADLRNQNLTAAPGGTAFEPFNQLWADLEGIIGSKFGDTIIGADSGAVDAEGVNPGDNWLIGGGGNDTFGTRVADANDSLGNGGNDVIVGDSVRLDALIGKYLTTGGESGYLEDHPELPQFDANGNRLHNLLDGTTLQGGLLGSGLASGFDKHFTALLTTYAERNLVLGNDTGAAGSNDKVILQGNLADYQLTALDAQGNAVVNPHANWDQVFAVLIHDTMDTRTLADGITVVPGDGDDLLIGIETLDFADDHSVNLQAFFDIAPTLDLDYVPVPDVSIVASDNFSPPPNNDPYGRGSGWAGSWQETDNNNAGTGQIQVSTTGGSNNNPGLVFDNGAGASIVRTVSALAGLSQATLNFSYNENGFDNGETVTVRFAADGTNFSDIGTINSNSNSGTFSYDLSTLLGVGETFSAGAKLQFVATADSGNGEYVRVDNIQITTPSNTFHDGDPGLDYSTDYTEQQTPASIAGMPLITDPDDLTVASATITLTDPVTGDQLDVGTLPVGIVATGAGTTTVTLSGVASPSDYQMALEAITFSNPTNDNPTSANRHVTVTVSDGLKSSAPATTTVHVTPVDDPATLGADTVITNVGTNTNFSIPDWALLANDSDPDSVMTISGIGGGSGIQTTGGGRGHSNTNGGTVTVSDSTPLGGSFTYSVTAPGTDPSATVTVTNQAGGNIVGTAASEIIVDSGTAHTITGGGGNDIVFGNGGDDTITTGAGNDYIDGGTGADAMTGGDGDDTYIIDDITTTGGNPATRDQVVELVNGGTDTVMGSVNLDLTLYTNVENATLTGNSGSTLTGSAGANVLTGNSGANTINAGGGNDTVIGAGGNDTIDAGAGDDTIIWNANTASGNNNNGTDGRDIIDGGANATANGDTFIVNGSASSETYSIYTAAAWLALGGNGGNGHTLVNNQTQIVVARGTNPSNSNVIAELRNIEEIVVNTAAGTGSGGNAGGDGDVVNIVGDFTGTSLNYNTIHINGGSGDDTVDVSGLTSDHRIVFHGAGGTNQVLGQLRPQDVVDNASSTGIDAPANDTEQSQSLAPDFDDEDAGESAEHGSDDDASEQDDDGPEQEDAAGSNATNPALAGAAAATLAAAIVDPSTAADPGTGAAPIVGTVDGNVLIGTVEADTILGLGGDDSIFGFGGDDVIRGDAGNDYVDAGSGNDIVFGGDGNDDLFSGEGNDMVYGDAGNDRIYAGAGNDIVVAGEGNDTVVGGLGDDTFVGSDGDGNDTYYGDDMSGGTGNDTLDLSAVTADLVVDLGNGAGGHGSAASALSGNDVLWNIENVVTGSGDDVIRASAAVNIIDGGSGDDVFIFGSSAAADGDTIQNFEPGDVIDLSEIDANALQPGSQAFTLVTGAEATAAGQLVVTHETGANGDVTVVSGYVSGTQEADFRIHLDGNHSLTADNFHL